MQNANIVLFIIGLFVGFVLASTIGLRALATEPVATTKQPTILGQRVISGQ